MSSPVWKIMFVNLTLIHMSDVSDARRNRKASDYFLLMRAIFLVAGIRAGLVLSSFRKVSDWLARRAGIVSGKGNRSKQEAEDRLVWAVSKASRVIPTDKPCLSQAMALKYLLAREGADSELVIGVAKEDDQSIKAHAWVERDGRILIGGGSSRKRYTRLASPEQYHG